MERTHPLVEEMDGRVFNSRQSWQFVFVAIMIKLLFTTCILTWRVNNYFSSKVKIEREETRVLIFMNMIAFFCKSVEY